MKLSTLFFFPAVCISAVVADGLVDRRGGRCHVNDQCLKGISNKYDNDPPLSSRLADCKALNTVTVSPYTVTTTCYTNRLVVRIPTGMPTGRQTINHLVGRAAGLPTATTIEPTNTPTYATYCASASEYFSACSRNGVTASVTTLPTPTTTVTVTTDDCYARRMVKRGGEALGYEFEPGWDGYNMPGIELF
ncbi:hypothetical protein EDB81DRAFT_947225 [Dactylonectria macrodidyma]|uniref:Uncharacterized protein n=1 Tax=Dactylonectria macrodidyma TaxID=307937 RepID=A0A9P9J6C0_9HYPO|nr:hypothetical protein EDB81DRAFT_947225 [Dactylonectria macrodidyma]